VLEVLIHSGASDEKSLINMRTFTILGIGYATIGLGVFAILAHQSSRIHDNYLKSLDKKGESIIHSISNDVRVKVGLMMGQEQLFHHAADKILEERELLYLVFYSESGEILHSDFNHEFGLQMGDFPDWPDLAGGPMPVSKEVESEIGIRALDMNIALLHAPASNGETKVLGWARIGLSTEQLQELKPNITVLWLSIMAVVIVVKTAIILQIKQNGNTTASTGDSC
jgi:hypothetical protein